MNAGQFFHGAPKASASAPGWVNPLGKHTDHNQGDMLPVAMSRRTAMTPYRSHDAHFCVALCSTQSAGQAAPSACAAYDNQAAAACRTDDNQAAAACRTDDNQAAAGVIDRILVLHQPVRERKENR